MARLTRDQRLDRSGAAWFEVDGVLARTTRASRMTPEQVIASVKIAGMGAVVARHIRDRVLGGRSAHGAIQPPGGGVTVTTREYAAELGATRRWWRTKREEYEAAQSRGRFWVTGGMWGGLQARSSMGGRAVVIDFRDSSIGAKGRKAGTRTIKRGRRRGQVVTRRASARVKNSEKAAAILARVRINVVQPSAAENMAMADAVANRIGRGVALALSADSVRMAAVGSASPSLYRSLRKYWEVP